MLEQRRVRGDLIETHKIIRGFDNVNCSKFFALAPVGVTRGNTQSVMYKKNVRLNCHKYFLVKE